MPETATVQIPMPEMGESVTEGIVLEWHVAEGDSVKEGDTIVEVSTDKVDAEVPAPMDGVITKLIAQVDDEVPVGAPLAEMEPGDGAGQGAGPAGPVTAGDPPPPATAQEGVPPTAPPARGASTSEGSN
ncbi:MAG: biotin/lipoyl-containing protein, partial [Solirubrobacterales bacterium]